MDGVFLERRHLVSFHCRRLPLIFTDVLVIGGGIAGLRAAIEAGGRADVIVLAKGELPDSNSRLGMRIGAQASVRVYTGDHSLFNRLGGWYMKALSYATYAY